jgi:serine/threonine protein kinase
MGTLLRKRYQIRSVLGMGRSGTTYLVKDLQATDPRRPLYLLKEIAGLDQQARYHLTVSSLTLRQLKHPALPITHALFNDDMRGCVYVVTDYIEGVSLDTLRQQQPNKRLPWSELRGICEQVANALMHLHQQDTPLYHGDLKPGCVVRNHAGRIILLGLDYTQQAGATQTRNTAAPSSYDAPEQFSGTIDGRTDVYGLGVMLYELLTGQRPVDAPTRMARMQRKRTDPLASASRIASAVPRPLAEILHTALALNPAERFQSIKAFWQALSTFAMQGGAAMPPAHRQRTPTPIAAIIPTTVLSPDSQIPAIRIIPASRTRRSPLPIVALLCALLLLLAGLGTLILARHGITSSGPSGNPSPSDRQTPPARGTPFPLPSPTAPVSVLGKYTGYFYFFDKDGNATPRTPFTLTIDHQNKDQFTGTFVAPGLSSTVRGTADQDRNVVWTVLDASGNAYITFSGGLNGIYASQTNTKDSGGGTLTRCQPGHGPICTVPPEPGNGGIWTLNLIPSAAAESVLLRV